MLSDLVSVLLPIVACTFFSYAEKAISSSNASRFKNDNSKHYVQTLLKNQKKFLLIAQLGRTIAVFAFGCCLAAGLSFSLFQNETLNLFVVSALGMLLMVTLGIRLPKRFAAKSASIVGISLPFLVASYALLPFYWLVFYSEKGVSKLLNLESNEDDVQEEEIRMLVDAYTEKGTIDEAEKEMIHNIFEFDNKTAEEVCIHRTDVFALDINAPPETVRAAMDEKFSRIPVYDGTIDNIIGILHTKDILRQMLTSENVTAINIRSILRKPFFVPASKKTDELFKAMQRAKTHIAVLIDEYGGTAGIVTLEDLIEEVMGNILDEYDDEETPDIQPLENGAFLANGGASLDVVADYFGIEFPGEFDTLSGFLVGQLGRIPISGEDSEVGYFDLSFKIKEIDDRMISQVLINKLKNGD